MLKKLSLFLVVCLMVFAVTQIAMAKDDSEESVTIPEWDNPYEVPEDIQEDLDNAETCYDLMTARLAKYKDEARYWRGIAEADSKGSQKMLEALDEIQGLQKLVAKNRTSLEKKSDSRAKCILATSQDKFQEYSNEIKNKINVAGYYIHVNGDEAVLTDDDPDSRCAKAAVLFGSLEEELTTTKNKLKEKILEGSLEKSAYAAELIKISEDNYAHAYELDVEYNKNLGNKKKMRLCTGIIDESNLGIGILTDAKEYYKGKKEDKSDNYSNLESKAKMMGEIIAEKQLEALALTNETIREEVLDDLNNAKEQILEVLKWIASEKYDKKQESSDLISNALDNIKSDIKTIDKTLYGADMEELTKKEKKAKANKLIKSATTHIKDLRSKAAKKAKKDDTEDEKDYVRYAKQVALKDAVAAKKTAKSYKNSKEYDETLKSVYSAIQTAKNGKDILKEVK